MSIDEAEIPEWHQPLSSAKRRRVQMCFEKGGKESQLGNFDYATEMFVRCVLDDPGNSIYIRVFLANLMKKYENNRKKISKLAGIKGSGLKGALKKAKNKKKYREALKPGLEMLALNPWDTGTWIAMATVAREMDFGECELAYLKGALDADIQDPEINKICAQALERNGDYPGAIACWHRVEKARPLDEEPKKAISELSVKKTIVDGKLQKNEDEKNAPKARTGSTRVRQEVSETATETKSGGLSEVDKMREEIAANPAELKNYLKLADHFFNEGQFDAADEVLKQADAMSGGHLDVKERREDIDLHNYRSEVEVARQRFEKSNTAENKKLYARKRAELNKLETDVYRNRVDRHPENLALKFELGLRLRRGGNIKEAIKVFQEARHDPRHPGEVALQLGECFQKVNQHRLALKHYEEAINEMPERNPDGRKKALYRAGVIAFFLKEIEVAEKHLQELAGLDFDYLDVAELLDKLAKIDKDK